MSRNFLDDFVQWTIALNLYETKYPGNTILRDIMNPNIAAANHIRDQRLISKTKKSYLGKLNVLRTFLRQNGYGETLLG